MLRKAVIALHFYFEVSFYQWKNIVINIKHIFCRLTNLMFSDNDPCQNMGEKFTLTLKDSVLPKYMFL